MSRLWFPFGPARPRGAHGLAALTLALGGALLAACAQDTVPGSPSTAQENGAPGGPPVATAPGAVPPQTGPAPEIVRVALIVPLSGSAAGLGQDLLDAAQLALFDIADARFEMRVYDSGGNGIAARGAAERAREDGAQLVIGPLLSDAVGGAAEVVRPAEIPMLTFSNNRLVAGDGIWTLGYLPEGQVARVIDFARRRGTQRFATLAPDDEYGSRMTAAFVEAVRAGIGEIVDTRYYLRDTDAQSTTIRALGRYDARKAALEREKVRLAAQDDMVSKRALARLATQETLGDVGFEALFLPAGGEEVLQLAPLLAYYDIDPNAVKLLGTWLWDDPALGKEPAMVGAWFAAPPPSARDSFVTRFEETYGRAPARLATLAYDATALAAVLARRDGPEGDPFAVEKLTHPDGFAGVDGLFRLLPSGLNERGLAVLEVRRDGPAVIDPAPSAFQAVVN